MALGCVRMTHFEGAFLVLSQVPDFDASRSSIDQCVNRKRLTRLFEGPRLEIRIGSVSKGPLSVDASPCRPLSYSRSCYDAMKRPAAMFFMPEGYCVKCKAKK